ncbi:hypothetical protein CVT25_001758, partial [Psilocybe cyanescens]
TPLTTRQESRRRAATVPLPLSDQDISSSPPPAEELWFDSAPSSPGIPPTSSPTHPPSVLPTPSPSIPSNVSACISISPTPRQNRFLLPKRDITDSSSESDVSISNHHFQIRRRHQRHALPHSEMSSLAEVKVSKLKDCPMLTAGKITPLILHTWTNACKRFLKHSGKEPDEIVSFVADAMLEPRLQAWYQSGSDRIDRLTLSEYIQELANLVLDKNWAHQIKQQILLAKQPEGSRFVDWRIEVENLNALLITSSKKHSFAEGALRDLLEANTRSALALKLYTNPVSEDADYKTWVDTLHALDEELRNEDKRFEAKMTAGKAEKKSLLSRLSDRKEGAAPSSHSSNSSSSSPSANARVRLTDAE